jgi:hypothetical protein
LPAAPVAGRAAKTGLLRRQPWQARAVHGLCRLQGRFISVDQAKKMGWKIPPTQHYPENQKYNRRT